MSVIFGRVGWYARAGGSIDLGVDACTAVDLDDLYQESLELIRSSRKEGTSALRLALVEIDFALDYCQNQGGRGYAWSRYLTVPECTKRLTRIQLQLTRTIEATESRLATAPRGGGCKKMFASDPFAALRRQRQAAKGIAA
jgi:hypothetical protein